MSKIPNKVKVGWKNVDIEIVKSSFIKETADYWGQYNNRTNKIEIQEEAPDIDKANTLGFEKVGFSYLPKENKILSDINIRIEKSDKIGIIGKTGSGKSTSLYAALKEIKSERTNITTVEDPVEYQLDGVNQVQVFEDIGLTFGSTLRSILRQDPDVLLIGEIRDGETADIAVKFALTGHLVFSTVHANDAPGTITRLLDIGIAPFLVGSCLNLVMAQRLVRRLCADCKEEYTPSNEELAVVGLDQKKINGPLYQGKGCAECRNTGYKGRLAIFEMIPMARDLRKLVFDNANEDEIRQTALDNGMTTLRDAGLARVLDGTTSIEEIMRSTVEDL